MACGCTSLTLRSFIVTIAEFDIFSHRLGKQLLPIKNFNLIPVSRSRSTPSFRNQLSSRAYTQNQKKLSEQNLHLKYSKAEEKIHANYGVKNGREDAIVEISPDTIDQLATDVHTNKETAIKVLNNIAEPSTVYSVEKTSQEEYQEKTLLLDLVEDISENKDPISKTKNFSLKSDRVHAQDLPYTKISGVRQLKIEKPKAPMKEPWMVEKERTKEKYPDGYRPLKRLSPDAIEGIRALHSQMPEYFTTARLAKEFKISPEAIRRILKSKWRPNIDEALDREARWSRRGEQIWSRWAELGATPPKKYRRLGIGEKPRPSHYQPDPLPKLVTTSTRRRSEDTGSSGSVSRKGGIL